jgi:hypothetical protein
MDRSAGDLLTTHNRVIPGAHDVDYKPPSFRLMKASLFLLLLLTTSRQVDPSTIRRIDPAAAQSSGAAI